MNELKLSGKVLNCYIDERGWFVCTIAVKHQHRINGVDIDSESILRTFLADKEKSAHVDVIRGDQVMITGYLRKDIRLSNTGKERSDVNIYIKEIELVKPKSGSEWRDSYEYA